MMTTLTTERFSACYLEQFWYTELGGFLNSKFDPVILTPVGFSVIF